MKSRSVACLILYNDQKEILLQHRSKTAKRSPGFWGRFGGGIEEGETPKEAMTRELIEELEYKVTDPKLITVTTWNEPDGLEITCHTFVEKFDSAQKIVLHEGQGYGWFTIDEALKRQIGDYLRNDLLKVADHLKGNRL